MLKINPAWPLLGLALLVLGLTHCSASRKSAAPSPVDSTATPSTNTDPWLEQLLRSYPQYFDTVLRRKDAFRIQIIYTRIDRDQSNTPRFKDHYYNVDPNAYFYPASTVKLPVAALALQRLRELSIPGLDRTATFITGSAYSGQTPVYNDPTTADGRPTIENYIKKILLVSDNDAFNRLYEFLGQRYINDQLQKMGYGRSAILHRLNIALSEDENRHTNPVRFLDPRNNALLYEQEPAYNEQAYPKRGDSVGHAYYKGGTLVEHPMDFSRKNKLTLPDLHNIVRSIVFPQSVPAAQRFRLEREDYAFLRTYMSEFPRESRYPAYDSAYYDSWCKFLLLGSEKNSAWPDGIRIFNKVGDAYGFLIDGAYICDFKNGVEFMLSAAIYCNTDEILNDDRYDYDSIGFPFLKHLGEVIYQHELTRERKVRPDLSEFVLRYE